MMGLNTPNEVQMRAVLVNLIALCSEVQWDLLTAVPAASGCTLWS